MTRRRTVLAAAAGGLVALAGAGAGLWSRVPVIPKRPDPDAGTALGWIAHRGGRFTLTLPRAEMGQNIATALKQVACAELGVGWHQLHLVLHATDMPRVKATVGSESAMLFAEPLAQAPVPPYDLVRLPVHTGPWRGLGADIPGAYGPSTASALGRAAARLPVRHAELPELIVQPEEDYDAPLCSSRRASLGAPVRTTRCPEPLNCLPR